MKICVAVKYAVRVKIGGRLNYQQLAYKSFIKIDDFTLG